MTTDAEIHKWFKIQQNDTLPIVTPGQYGRKDLAAFMAFAGFKYGAEIGVWQGDYSEVLCKINPTIHLICVDPWCGYACSTGWQMSDEQANKAYQTVQDRLGPKKMRRNPQRIIRKGYDVEYLRMTSIEALEKVADKSLDFAYIDEQHDFDSKMLDLIGWSRKVRSGGIVAGRAYFALTGNNTITAVNAYTYGHCIFKWYVMRDHEPTFFWVKP